MYLKRITITGFKSFAHKTVLELTPGITAIVGPNGSGKSNIADAVRWVLGEQSGKSLRAKKGEDVIFAGTDKQARASAAEVILLLDNSDGRAPLDVAEIQISRKLYRSGESEYRLNDRKVRLADLEHLLAQAGFGTETYAVVGQGMVDNLIMASPAERKTLFDEASGIKEFELKREQAVRKLERTRQNMQRIGDVLSELAPRLATLARAAKAAEERKHLAADLGIARAEYLNTSAERTKASRMAAQQNLEIAQNSLTHAADRLKLLEKEQRELQSNQQEAAEAQAKHAKKLEELETARGRLLNEASIKRAELQFAEEKHLQQVEVKDQLAETEAAIKRQRRIKSQLVKQLAEAQVAEQEYSEELRKVGKKIDNAQRSLVALRSAADQTSSQEYVAHALSILKQVSYALTSGTADNEQIRLLVYKAGRLLGLASRGGESDVEKIKQAQHHLTTLMKEREQAHEPYTNAVIRLRSVELDMAHNAEELARLEEQALQLSTQLGDSLSTLSQKKLEAEQLATQLEQIEAELRTLRAQGAADVPETTSRIFELATQLEACRQEKSALETKISGYQGQLAELADSTNQLTQLAKDWFKGEVPKTETSSAGSEVLEREVYILEAKLQETKTEDAVVLEEYEDTQKRHSFLSEQLQDLEAAAADIEAVIDQLGRQIRITFEKNFAAIAEDFDKYFKALFGGGRAELKLESVDGVYGIEISAVPPGKRQQSLATLSGGEKALTGTALLAAILSTNPSPFVVLDEIDAALDEANSGRLGTILASLTKHSQLIVITHNRQIMAAAGLLYGVTIDGRHASKLLSVKFEKAAELAAKR